MYGKFLVHLNRWIFGVGIEFSGEWIGNRVGGGWIELSLLCFMLRISWGQTARIQKAFADDDPEDDFTATLTEHEYYGKVWEKEDYLEWVGEKYTCEY